jgi:hypothetical protein
MVRFVHDIIKAPLRDLKIFVLVLSGFMVLCMVSALFWVDLAPVLHLLVMVFFLFLVVLVLLLITRLWAKIHDIQYSISLFANLSHHLDIPEGLLVDGAAGSPSLQLFLLKCLLLCKPRAILELGSGQTTKLFARYHKENPDTYVLTIENSQHWADKMADILAKWGHCHDYRCSPLENKDFPCPGTGERVKTLWYKEIPEIKARKFNLILVDGPDSGPIYTRAGILQYMPEILEAPFIIVFDDAERSGERQTMRALERVLQSQEQKFIRFEFSGRKTQAVFCSPEYGFLQSI